MLTEQRKAQIERSLMYPDFTLGDHFMKIGKADLVRTDRVCSWTEML